MPTHTIHLSDEQETLLNDCSKSLGQENDDVMARAITLLHDELKAEAWKTWELRRLIREGMESPTADGDIFEQVRAESGIPRRAAQS